MKAGKSFTQKSRGNEKGQYLLIAIKGSLDAFDLNHRSSICDKENEMD